MSKRVYFFETCTRCGFPFADCDAHFYGAVQRYETHCPKCGLQEIVSVVRETSEQESEPCSNPVRSTDKAWGTFRCSCGATGVIEVDNPGEELKRATMYCSACEKWSRWYRDWDSGTLD